MYDAHTHLQDARFDSCREAVLAAAMAAGVAGACCCGSSASDWRAVNALAENRGFATGFLLLPAFGVHPWHAGIQPADWLGQLEAYLMRHPESPVGEIGIDGLRDDPPRDVQRQVLCAQLELAVRLSRPVVLHGARAWGELLAIIKPYAPRLPGLVAHAFGGSADILRDVVAMDGFVSFAGPVCNPAAKRVRAAAAAAPLERLLIETDAPDMLPHGAGSRFRAHGSAVGEASKEDNGPAAERNHPANLVYVARTLATIRGVPVEEIAAVTTENARRAYRLP
ncbi:MAG: TatD family hydrolase [bacterium]